MTIDIQEINEKLIKQDLALRAKCVAATEEPNMLMIQETILEALCAIHERLGNIIYFNLMTGGR